MIEREFAWIDDLKLKVAYAYGGGGYNGCTQVGPLLTLEDIGIIPFRRMGVSVGALNATLSSAALLERVWTELVEKKGHRFIFNFRRPKVFWRVFTPWWHGYLLDNDGICELVGKINFEDLISPVRHTGVIIHNKTQKKPKIFWNNDPLFLKPEGKGNFSKVMLASCSMDGWYSRVSIDGEDYCDEVELSVRPLFQREKADLVIAFITDPLDYNIPLSWFSRMRGTGHQITDSRLNSEGQDYGERLMIVRSEHRIPTLSSLWFRNGDISAMIEMAREESAKTIRKQLRELERFFTERARQKVE